MAMTCIKAESIKSLKWYGILGGSDTTNSRRFAYSVSSRQRRRFEKPPKKTPSSVKMVANQPHLTFNNGLKMPAVGFGTWQVRESLPPSDQWATSWILTTAFLVDQWRSKDGRELRSGNGLSPHRHRVLLRKRSGHRRGPDWLAPKRQSETWRTVHHHQSNKRSLNQPTEKQWKLLFPLVAPIC